MQSVPLEVSVGVSSEVEPLLQSAGIDLAQFEEQVNRAFALAVPYAQVSFEALPMGNLLECHLLLTDDAHIAQLNTDYRGIDSPTDVLSFEYGADSPVLGDIVISVETAQRQAVPNQHDLMTELLILGLHGALHLLGYEDETEAGRDLMVQRSIQILSQMGYPANSAWYSRYNENEP
ncbi:MAG: rRNA maturation RNase YbeY [Fimbriimonadales bacterium]